MTQLGNLEVQIGRTPDLFSSLGTPASLVHVSRFVRATGIEVPQFQPKARSYLGAAPKSVLAKIATFFSAARVKSEFDEPLPVSVHQIHCPRVKGATGKLTVVQSESHGASFSVEVLGLGGGDAADLTFEAGDAFDTELECRELVYSFDARWEVCEIAGVDGKWKEFVRLKELYPKRRSVDQRKIIRDDCTDPAMLPQDAEDRMSFDLIGPDKVPIQRTFTVKDENAWTVRSQLDFPKVGLTLKTELRGKRTFTTSCTYTLPIGAKYIAFKPADAPAWLWRHER